MYVMGGFGENGNLHKICRYLGIYDSLDLQHIDSDCIDEIHYKKKPAMSTALHREKRIL